MKLLYTDMSQDLTEILTEQATSYAQKGKRVFYIAPNALSFEKERKVLEYLPQSASFEITVTRFTQMARYFILNTSNPKTQLDDTGLAMIFYKVLSHMGDDELKVYGRLRKDSNFINQLVDLYKELQQANMTVLDLQHLDQVEKQEDLLRISVQLRTSCWQEILTINQNLVPSSRKLPQAIWIRPWVTRFWSLMALRVSLPRRRP